MTKDIQSALLRACARFIGKKVDPITRQVDELRTQFAGTITKEQLEQIRQAWEEKLSKPEEWLSKELIPPGEPGRDADPIAIPDVVAELLATDDLKTIIDLHVVAAVTEYFEANPIQHGKDAEPVSDEQVSKSVNSYLAANPPAAGKDGTSVTADDVKGVVEFEVMKGLRDLERHAGEVIQRAADQIPNPKDGKDGADFTNTEIDYDGERGLIIRGKGGEIVKHLPIPIDRGYWREGMKAEKSDIMTASGSAWIALKDTDKKPGLDCPDDWRIFARKGRDGGKGDAGKDYKPPEPVKLS